MWDVSSVMSVLTRLAEAACMNMAEWLTSVSQVSLLARSVVIGSFGLFVGIYPPPRSNCGTFWSRPNRRYRPNKFEFGRNVHDHTQSVSTLFIYMIWNGVRARSNEQRLQQCNLRNARVLGRGEPMEGGVWEPVHNRARWNTPDASQRSLTLNVGGGVRTKNQHSALLRETGM